MVLSSIAIAALKGLDRTARVLLAAELGTTPKTLNRWIAENRDNGPLTTVGAQNLIALELKVPDIVADFVLLAGGPGKEAGVILVERMKRAGWIVTKE